MQAEVIMLQPAVVFVGKRFNLLTLHASLKTVMTLFRIFSGLGKEYRLRCCKRLDSAILVGKTGYPITGIAVSAEKW